MISKMRNTPKGIVGKINFNDELANDKKGSSRKQSDESDRRETMKMRREIIIQ